MAALWGIFTSANLIGFVIIFFVLAICNRQFNDLLGVPFNKWFAWLMLVPYLIADIFIPLKWAIAIGLFGGIIVGVLTGMFMGGDDGGDE